MKIVCIGDFHVPDRAGKIPSWVRKKIQEENPDKLVCTGDFTSEKTLREVQKLGELVAVKGNMDWVDLPEHAVLKMDGFNVGVIHGSGIVPRGDLNQLAKYAKRMKSRVLIHGHTHKMSIQEQGGVLFINPGSATGVWGGSSEGGPQTFVILELEGNTLLVRKITDREEESETYEL